MQHRFWTFAFLFGGVFFSGLAFSDTSTVAPVSASAPAAPQVASVTPKQLSVLQHKVAFLQNLNVPARLSNIQQAIQTLNGQVQVLQHDVALLNKQQRSFYHTLSQRITQIQALSDAGSSAVNNVVTNALPKKGAAVKAMPVSAEQQAFDTAYALVKTKKYAQAITAFRAYLVTYPQAKQLVSAHYWLGEMYLAVHLPKKAQSQFAVILANFPSAERMPDVLLGLIQAAHALNQPIKAKQYAAKLLKDYPSSPAALAAQP